METTLIRMPGGAIISAKPEDVEQLIAGGGELVPQAATIDKFGRATTAADPLSRTTVDTFGESLAGVREGRMASYEDEGLQAFGEGIATSLTAGLYGGDDEDQALRAEVNPYASLGGQALGLVGGAIAGPVLGGAAGLASKAGSLAAGLAEARGVGAVGRLAIEGVVDGVGYATMREGIGATVYDKPFSVEAVALEGLTGAGVGAGIGMAAKGFGAIKKALTKEDIAGDVLRSAMAKDPTITIQPGAEDPFASGLDAPSTGVFDQPTGLPGLPSPGFAGPVEPDDLMFNNARTSRSVVTGPRPPAAKDFYRDMPHMQVVDEHFGAIWKDIDELQKDLVAIPADHPAFHKLEPLWRQMQADRRAVAKGLGVKGVEDEVIATQRDLVTYNIKPDAWRSMDPRKLAEQQTTIDAFNNLVGSARKLDEAMLEVRDAGETWMHVDQALDLSGGSSHITGKTSGATRRQLVEDRLKAYVDYIEKRQTQMPGRIVRSDADYVVREILRKGTGKATSKMAKESNRALVEKWAKESDPMLERLRKQLRDLGEKVDSNEQLIQASQKYDIVLPKSKKVTTSGTREKSDISGMQEDGKGQTFTSKTKTKQELDDGLTVETRPDGFQRTKETEEALSVRVRGSRHDPMSPKAWNSRDARPVAVIKRAIEHGEPPHIEEILMLTRSEQQEVLKGLKQRHWDSLEYEVISNPSVMKFTPESTKISDEVLGGASRAGSRLNEEAFFAPPPVQKPRRSKRAALHSNEPIAAAGTDGIPVTGATGNPLGDVLTKTNLMGLAVAGMFPKLAVAKVIIQKYGAAIAGAAEATLSSKSFQAFSRKLPQLAWATMLAPGGSDHDRNMRAIHAASNNPDAFAAIVDDAMSNITSDSPEKQVEARERISVQLEWLMKNMPQSLSQLGLVVSNSSVSAFNLLVEAWINPMKVLENGKTAPTAQLSAVRELWPQSFQDWLAKVVDGAATMAAEGKPIPRAVGRLLPMASQSWTPSGIKILQTVTMEKAQNQGGKPNAEVLSPTTTVESLSKNRIELNR